MEREEREDEAVEEALDRMERAERERAEARELRARANALDARADKEERDAVRDLEGRGHGHGHGNGRGGHGGGDHGQPGHSGGGGDGHGPEPRQIDIVVNGRERKVPPGRITYEHVLELAFGSAATAVTHTVNWRAHDGHEGSLLPGGSVAVCEGMIFTATATNRS